MGSASNVPNGAGWRASLAFEIIRERIDVWSTDSGAEAPQRLGCRKKLL
jgi:hypothetical protein